MAPVHVFPGKKDQEECEIPKGDTLIFIIKQFRALEGLAVGINVTCLSKLHVSIQRILFDALSSKGVGY